MIQTGIYFPEPVFFIDNLQGLISESKTAGDK
jgi:hypothetical protein